MVETHRSDDTASPPGADAISFELRPLADGLGLEVVDLQVADIDDALFPSIYALFLEHQVLLFRDQDLPPGAQVAFARRFGEVQVHVMNQYHADGYPELYTLSNVLYRMSSLVSAIRKIHVLSMH